MPPYSTKLVPVTLFERLATLTKSRQRKLGVLVGAVALPALILAGFATLLTLRVAREVQAESTRYSVYVEGKVTEAFEQELVAQLRDAVVPAEGVARDGGSREALLAALASRSRRFEAPHYVPVEEMVRALCWRFLFAAGCKRSGCCS